MSGRTWPNLGGRWGVARERPEVRSEGCSFFVAELSAHGADSGGECCRQQRHGSRIGRLGKHMRVCGSHLRQIRAMTVDLGTNIRPALARVCAILRQLPAWPNPPLIWHRPTQTQPGGRFAGLNRLGALELGFLANAGAGGTKFRPTPSRERPFRNDIESASSTTSWRFRPDVRWPNWTNSAR